MDNLNKKLRELRAEMGLTQLQAASIIGLSQSAYAKYESGQRGGEAELEHAIEKLKHFNMSQNLEKSIYALATAEFWLCSLLENGVSPSLFEKMAQHPLAGLTLIHQQVNALKKSDKKTLKRVSELLDIVDIGTLSTIKDDNLPIEKQGIWIFGWYAGENARNVEND